MKPLMPVLCALLSASFAVNATAQDLTAEEIVANNITARGGLDAWRNIHSMVWIGHIENTLAGASSLPFALRMKRPHKTRFEINVQNRISLRLFDGTQGWKLRATDGPPVVQPYTAEEVIYARDGPGMDGLLMNYQTQGGTIALDGVDTMDGRRAYRLDVTLPSGVHRHVWIDTQTFLESKDVRVSRNALGKEDTISVYYRDYDTIDGLRIPRTLETRVNNAPATEKMVIDRIVLNPPLSDRVFAKPHVPGQRNRAAATQRAQPMLTGARAAR